MNNIKLIKSASIAGIALAAALLSACGPKEIPDNVAGAAASASASAAAPSSPQQALEQAQAVEQGKGEAVGSRESENSVSTAAPAANASPPATATATPGAASAPRELNAAQAEAHLEVPRPAKFDPKLVPATGKGSVSINFDSSKK